MRHLIDRLPVAAGVMLVFARLALGQAGSPPADRIQAFNQELTGLSSQPSEAAVNHVRALIKSRLAAFTELAETDPSRAIELALPESILVRLRGFAPDVEAGLESDGEWSGPAEVVVEDDFEHHTSRTRISIQSGGEWLAVYTAGGAPGLQSGVVIGSRGLRMGPMILARDLKIIPRPAALGCSTTGAQKLAVVMVNFLSSSINTASVNSGTLGAIINGGTHNLTGYWNEASYGLTSATGDVYGPYNLGADYTGSDYTAIQTAAINAAANTGGVNFSNYNHVVIVMPNGFPVGGGLGTIGCSSLSSPTTGAFQAGVVWLRADFTIPNDVGVCAFAHEDGHNLGLDHASTESYGSVPLGSFGTVPVHTEYGSYFSLMSECWTFSETTLLGHYDAQHKAQLGWFVPSNYQTVSASGSFTLTPTETSTSNLHAIRVQRGLENNFWLWLEYRQSIGYDSTLTGISSQIYSGAMIHFEDPTNTAYLGYTRLLNYTAPAHSDFSQPALAVGSSWSDPYSLLTLHVNSADSAGLHVAVNYDTPCASLTPTSRSYSSSGAVASDSVTVAASGSCSWTGTSNASWISINSGSSGGGSGTLTYSLTANTTPSPRTGTITIARQAFTITQASSNPQPTPVSVSPDNSSSAPGTAQAFSFIYSDKNGASDFAEVSLLFNSSTSLAAGCNVAWFKSDNSVRLYDDAGDGGYSYWYANQSSNISNSQCSARFSNAVATSGNNLTLTLTITFSSSFAGTKNIYMEAQDPLGADSGLTLMGTWSVGSFTPITVTTSPTGLSITVDGTSYTAPQDFNWIPGANHTVNVSSPQGGAGMRYAFANWSDAGAQSHTIVTPGSTATYTANFTTQHLLTTSVAPSATGTISSSPPSGDGYYNSGTSVQLTASPVSG